MSPQATEPTESFGASACSGCSIVLVLVLVLSPTGRYSYSVRFFGLYHYVLVSTLVGVGLSEWKANQRPKRENELQLPGAEYRTIAMLLSTTSHRVRVRVPYAHAS
jgi:hypothetical protein